LAARAGAASASDSRIVASTVGKGRMRMGETVPQREEPLLAAGGR
jgi:hypothetical protein